MMKKITLTLTLLAVAAGFFTGCRTGAFRISRAHDFHVGIWLNRHIMQEGEQAIIDFLEDARERGVTDVYPNFWFHGYTIYPDSAHVRQHPDFVGWDPLAVVVREAERLGMGVHPWGEYGFFAHFNRTNDQEDVGYILEQLPTWLVENREGRNSLYNADLGVAHFSMNPAHPGVQRFLRNLMLEPARLYPGVAGIHLDRIRYQGRDFSYDRYSRDAFSAEHGFDPLHTGLTGEQLMRWERWRIEQINEFMRTMAEAFREQFPRKTLSAAVLPPYMMDEKFQRWDEWVASRHLDVPVPMIYGQREMVEREIDLALRLVPRRRPIYVGLDVGAMSEDDLLGAAEYARERGAAGIVLWDDTAFRRKKGLRFSE